MKKSHFFATILLFTMLFQAQSATNETDMQAFARNFMNAYNQQNHTAIQNMYTDDAVHIDGQGKQIKGGDNIGAYFAEQFRLNNVTVLVRQKNFQWSGSEHAWVDQGTYEVYGKTKLNDQPIHFSTNYSNIMTKENGDWKIANSKHSPLTESENVSIVDGLYKAFAKGDIPNALSTMDADIVWNEAESFPYADNNPYKGPDAVLNGVFARIGAEWEYWNLTDIKLHDMSNNMVLSTLRYKAKHKETGKVIDLQTAHLFTLKDGKITAFQQYTDTKQVAEAMR